MTEAISHNNSFTMTALIRLFHGINKVNENNAMCWNTEISPRRLFFVSNLVDSYLYPSKSYHSDPSESIQHLKVRTTIDLTIKDLAESLARFVGFRGEILWDQSKFDSTPRKQLDLSNLLTSSCQVKIPLQQVINIYYNKFFYTNRHKSTV